MSELNEIIKEKRSLSKEIIFSIIWISIPVVVFFAGYMWDSVAFKSWGISSPIEVIVLGLIMGIIYWICHAEVDPDGLITIKKDLENDIERKEED